jgi:hypothetical protein
LGQTEGGTSVSHKDAHKGRTGRMTGDSLKTRATGNTLKIAVQHYSERLAVRSRGEALRRQRHGLRGIPEGLESLRGDRGGGRFNISVGVNGSVLGSKL